MILPISVGIVLIVAALGLLVFGVWLIADNYQPLWTLTGNGDGRSDRGDRHEAKAH